MNGESHRSRSGQAMFSESDTKTPFSKLRFEVDALVSPLTGGAGASGSGRESQRFGLPADRLMDEVLQTTPMLPTGFVDRLHEVVDGFSDNATE